MRLRRSVRFRPVVEPMESLRLLSLAAEFSTMEVGDTNVLPLPSLDYDPATAPLVDSDTFEAEVWWIEYISSNHELPISIAGMADNVRDALIAAVNQRRGELVASVNGMIAHSEQARDMFIRLRDDLAASRANLEQMFRQEDDEAGQLHLLGAMLAVDKGIDACNRAIRTTGNEVQRLLLHRTAVHRACNQMIEAIKEYLPDPDDPTTAYYWTEDQPIEMA